MFRRLLMVSVVCAACGGSGEPEVPASRPPPPAPQSARPSELPAMAAWKFTEVPTATFGPYLAEGPNATIAVWAAREGETRRWFSIALSEQGKPLAEQRAIANAPADIGLVSVRPLATASAEGGFVVLSTTRDFSGARLDALTVTTDGQMRGGPVVVAQSLPDIAWIDCVPTDTGAIVFWAVKSTDRASIRAAELGANGEIKTSASDILADARAWQVAATGTGAAVAAVTTPTPPNGTGPVTLALMDGHGKLVGRPVVVSKDPTAELDLDLVFHRDRLVLVWTDRRDVEWRVFTAVADQKGTVVQAPTPLTEPFGPQALIRLVPPSTPRAPAFVLWENSVERPAHGRRLRVGRLGDNGALAPEQATLDFAAEDGSMPELSGTSNGMAAITLAPLCRQKEPCDDASLVPTFVRLDERLDVVASEPIRLSPLDGGAAELAWNLNCRRFECLALGAVTSAPAPIFVVQLGPASNGYTAAARRHVPEPPPRAATLAAVAQTESAADMAVARVGDKTLLAWITYFDPSTPAAKPTKPAPDGRMAPVEAMLRVHALGGGAPEVISYRARSLGGVAMAADAAGKEALVAWVALDQKHPQVFLTVVGPDGKKRRQRMLSHATGEVSDVAVTEVGNGWIVAWVDERSGHPEVFATKVDRQLRRIVPERVLSQLSGDASDVQLLVTGQHVLVVWAQAADARGYADLYATRLSAADASPVGPAHPVTQSREHSHSPALAAFDEGGVVAWLEEVPTSEGGAVEASVMLRRLDSGAEAVGSPVIIALEGVPRSVSIACQNRVCRIVAESMDGKVQELEALEWAPEQRERHGRLVALSGRSEDAVRPAQLSNEVFYADPSAEGDVHLRRLEVVWAE